MGGGGMGVVRETTLGGTAVALKLTYSKHLSEQVWNEIDILKQISGQRHRHIVELIGAYHQRQQGLNNEIGLLFWPVATTDMAAFLLDVDGLGDWLRDPRTQDPRRVEDAQTAVENVVDLLPPSQRSIEGLDIRSIRTPDLVSTYNGILQYLRQSFGCTANALAWLHRQGIRHKDIKPSQILLSPDGLWLTDFGMSKNVSHLTKGETSGGDRITPKYHAPERSERKRCGKPEDIFSLGCTFLEMGTRLARYDPRQRLVLPWSRGNFTFQENIRYVDAWLAPFQLPHDPNLALLGRLIKDMVRYDQNSRPSADQVVQALAQFGNAGRSAASNRPSGFFARCCAPRAS